MDPRVLAYLPLVTPVATLMVVFIGILFSNRHVDVRIADLRAHMDSRFEAERRVNEANTKMILGKMDDLDTRLGRLEERFAR